MATSNLEKQQYGPTGSKQLSIPQQCSGFVPFFGPVCNGEIVQVAFAHSDVTKTWCFYIVLQSSKIVELATGVSSEWCGHW